MKTAAAVGTLMGLSLGIAAHAAVSPRVLYVHHARAVVAGLDGSNLTDLSSLVGDAAFAAWSPDGTLVEVVGAAGIYVVAASGGPPRLLAPYDSDVRSAPVWSPDGTRIAYIAGGAVATVPVSGGPPVPLTGATRFEGSLSWLPDGSRLLVSDDRTPWTIYAVSYPGGRVTTLGAGDQAVWAPGGGRIAFRTRAEGIAVMSADGSDPRELASANAEDPEWLGDAAVVFTSYDRVPPIDRIDNGVRPNVYVARVDGSAPPTRVTGAFAEREGSAGGEAPVPSPDGAQIEFSGVGDRPWRVNADGTCPERIGAESDAGAYLDWAWQPASRVGHVSCSELWTVVSRVPRRIAVGKRAVVRVTVENHGDRTASGASLRATALTPHTTASCGRCTLAAIPAGASTTMSMVVSSSRWQTIRVRISALAPHQLRELDTAVVQIDAVPRRR